MKRLLLIVLLMTTTRSFATDVIVTTNGDVTAGVTRNHTRAIGFPGAAGYQGNINILIGEDSTSTTSHKLFLWYSQDEGNSWTQRTTRPFTTPSGWGSGTLDPIMTYYKDGTDETDTLWMLPPNTYSGSNMQAVRTVGTAINGTDTINPGNNSMTTGLMRWKNGGDTLIYAYNDQTEGFTAVVRSNGAWSQSVTWTAIDTLLADLNDVNSDYCGSGVAVWDRAGLDMYWIDGTVNDAFKTLGSNIVPTLLTTTKMNATTMAVYKDSLITVIAYLARDTCLWQYRWYATGGSRKTGLTLIDSTKLLPKNYFAGNATDSMSPMPCLSGTVDGDTAVLQVRYWPNPSNADSIVVGRSMASAYWNEGVGGIWGVAAFDSINLTRNATTYGEGLRFRGLCAPRYITENAMVFWQKGVSTPDSIWCSYDIKQTYVVEQLPQIKTDAFSTAYTFQGASEVQDVWIDNSNPTWNYGSATTLQTSTGSATTRSALLRPLIKTKIPYPCHIVWCSLDVKIQTNTPNGSYSAAVNRIWKPVYEGTQTGGVPGNDSGATHTVGRTGMSWGAAGASLNAGNEIWTNTTGAGRDRSAGQLNSTSWPTWGNQSAGTVKGKPLLSGMDNWNRYLRGETADSLHIGWVRFIMSAANTVIIHSSEAATSTDAPKFYFNAYFTEPGVRRNPWQQNFRRRYITPGLRYKRI